MRPASAPSPSQANAPLRVFFAVWPDAAAREALAKLARAVTAAAGGHAPAIENLHLTLAFVGDVAEERVAALRAVGLEASTGVPAFDLSLDRVGVFRGSGIAWAGASCIPAELLQLVSRLNEALTAQGFPTDPRPFQAHVTLARRCRRQPGANGATPIAWTVATLTLNASELAPGGPRYRELAAWSLGPRNSHEQGTQVPRE